MCNVQCAMCKSHRSVVLPPKGISVNPRSHNSRQNVETSKAPPFVQIRAEEAVAIVSYDGKAKLISSFISILWHELKSQVFLGLGGSGSGSDSGRNDIFLNIYDAVLESVYGNHFCCRPAISTQKDCCISSWWFLN